MSLIHGVPLSCPVHATFQVSPLGFFAMPTPAVWKILEDTVAGLQQPRKSYVHAVVLMSTHIHLLLTPAERATQHILEEMARRLVSEIRPLHGPSDPQFGLCARSYEIRHPVYFSRALKYIYRNPVCAGLCRRVEEYPFSTVHALLGSMRFRFPLHDTYYNQMIPVDSGELLLWLNTPEINLPPGSRAGVGFHGAGVL